MKRARERRALRSLITTDIRQERRQETCNCPYCGSRMVIKKGIEVNPKFASNEYMTCINYPACDSYARVIKVDGKYELVSTPANKELRMLRNEAHYWVEQLIKTGIAKDYKMAFAMTSQRLSITNGYRIHIGQCRELTCREIITACVNILYNNKDRISNIKVWNNSNVNDKAVLDIIKELEVV